MVSTDIMVTMTPVMMMFRAQRAHPQSPLPGIRMQKICDKIHIYKNGLHKYSFTFSFNVLVPQPSFLNLKYYAASAILPRL